MIKGLLWDMGGVLVHDEMPATRTAWEQKLGLAEGELTRMVFWQPLALDLLLGTAETSAMWRLLEQELGRTEGELDALEDDFWGAPNWQEDVWAYLRQQPAGLKQGVLSDAWLSTRQVMHSRINDEQFDAIVFSSEEGVKKPQPEIYRLACQRLGAEPGELIFIDDRIGNIEGARRCGMWAVEFTELSAVRQQIDEIMAQQGS